MVYLIHFEVKLQHAQHYLGFTQENLEQRIKQHQNGTGAKILKACNERGIKWSVVRTWPEGTRTFERQLKNRKKARCLCPQCKENVKNSN